jgi:alkylhydroperoxidase family enzyme
MNAFLPPIERPQGLLMKLAYYFTRRQFGKVLTRLKVWGARLPLAFGLFSTKIGKLGKKLRLPSETALLVRIQVARINVCLFCRDIGRSVAIKASINEAKFDALDRYNTSSLLADAERAALDYVTELTRDKKVNPDAFLACPLLFRARNLRDRVAYCQRAFLQHDQHRSEHPFGHALWA